MALVAEPECHRDGRQRVTLAKHHLCPGNAHLLEVLVGRQSRRVPEDAAQMKAAHARDAREFAHARHSAMGVKDAGPRNFHSTLAPEIPGSADRGQLPSKRAPYPLRQTLRDAAVGGLAALEKQSIENISGFRIVNDRTDETNRVEVNTAAENATHGCRCRVDRTYGPTAW